MEILIGLLMVCAIWAVTASLLIARDLEERGVPVSFVCLRFAILKYLHQYSEITREDTGHVGSLFYHYVIPLNVALALAIVLAIAARS
jgi:hypothetical protein